MENGSRRREQSMGGVPIRKSGSDMGRSMAIPMKSRQSSTTSLSDQKDFKGGKNVTDPTWNHEAVLCVSLIHTVIEKGLMFSLVMFLESIPMSMFTYTIAETMKRS